MTNEYSLSLIEYNSREYEQACQLRYKLFFAEHNLPRKVVRDKRQAEYFHAAILVHNCVVAYGQLVPQQNQIYQICQMVVEPSYQRKNLGSKILSALIAIAIQEQAIAVTLNARVAAVGFYQKLGFQTNGEQFPSKTTGVIHVSMRCQLNYTDF